MMRWLRKGKSLQNQSNIEVELIKKSEVYCIPCDRIRANTMRSRCDFDEDKIISLAYSIKHYGVIEPLCVKKTDDEDSYDFEIIAGERRLRAAKLAELTSVPCIIIEADQGISAELSLIENVYSEPLNYFEVAVALKRLLELDDGSFEELAARLSIPQSALLKKLWLLELEYDERQSLLNMDISEEIAVAIAKITDKSRRREMIECICENKVMKSTENEYAELCARSHYNDSASDLPRDINSVIKGISSKTKLLNRHGERAKMKVLRTEKTVTVEISIKL